VLFGKGLAQRWEGRWDEELNGKAMKTAKAIYLEEI
jgi:hypothetical protein